MFEGGSGQRQIALPFWGKEGAVPFYWLPLFLQLEQPPGNDEEGFTGLRGDKLVGEAEAVTVVPPEPGRFDAAEPGFAGNNHPSATGRADYVEQRFRLAAYSTLESAEIFGIRQAEQDIRYPQGDAVQQRTENQYTCRGVFGLLPVPPTPEFDRRRMSVSLLLTYIDLLFSFGSIDPFRRNI